MTVGWKRTLLRIARAVGGFRVARRLLARGALRILCYHGIATVDEHRFRGRLFMHPDTFRARMELLRAKGFPVLALDDAVHRLCSGTLPEGATVLTFDDGWHAVYEHALPVLEELGWPATIYVTSYYCERRYQVFNVALQYLFWKAARATVDIDCLPHPGTRTPERGSQRHGATCDQLLAYAQSRLSAAERQALLRRVGEHLGVDFERLDTAGAFYLMSPAEVADAYKAGFDIQLHTHRHSLHGMDSEAVAQEISDNRTSLSQMVPSATLKHFCYPSGIYSPGVWPTLKDVEIESATTCDPGLNFPGSPHLALRRILDEEDICDAEFLGEMTGFLEFRRRRVTAARSCTQ